MKKYTVKFGNPNNPTYFETNSRDSKKHLKEWGGNRVFVCNKSGKVISAAGKDENGKIHNIEVTTYNEMFEKYGRY